MKSEILLIGDVRLGRARCPDCKRLSLVVDGKTVCCEAPTPTPTRIRRIAPSLAISREPMQCPAAFGSLSKRDGQIMLRLVRDHMGECVKADCFICSILKGSPIEIPIPSRFIKARKARRTKPPKPRGSFSYGFAACRKCSTRFEKITSGQVYCSPECRKAHYEERGERRAAEIVRYFLTLPSSKHPTWVRRYLAKQDQPTPHSDDSES